MLLMRSLTVRLLKAVRLLLSSLNRDHRPNFNLRGSSCYLCKILSRDPQELCQMSVSIKKLSIFLEDLIFFTPRNQEMIMGDLQKLSQGKNGFSMQEVSQYEAICQKLNAN
jgi:hypothetical protein